MRATTLRACLHVFQERPLLRFGAAAFALLAVSCAPAPSPATRAPVIDAVLPAADGWRVFRLGALQHAVLPAGVDVAADPDWNILAAPAGPFRPVQAIPGHRGYFHLVDAASGRLCLYDEDGALLSTHPLPEEFVPFPAGRVAVFRGAGGAFTFVEYGSGEARQYADRRTVSRGGTQWVPRGTVKLPASTRDCVQPPGSPDLHCRLGGGEPVRFDGALNRIPLRGRPGGASVAGPGSAARAVWDADAGEWAIEVANGSGPSFRHYPVSRRWMTGAEGTAPGPPAAP